MTKPRAVLVTAAMGAISAVSLLAGSLTPQSTARQSQTVTVEELHPFTHFAAIPTGADLSSIHFRGVRKVKVATQSKSTFNVRYCEEAVKREPGGSMSCPSTELLSLQPAYQVTYSYNAEPLTSDEYGNRFFTFSVYFRPDELSPAAIESLTGRHLDKAAIAALFAVTTHRDPVRQVLVDERGSKFCAGNLVDGEWRQSDSNCQDQIRGRAITTLSPYITVEVTPVHPALASASD